MQWRGRRQSDNIEDVRGSGGGFSGGGMRFPGGGFPGGGRRGGGLSIGGLIAVGLVLWFLGINPLVLIDGSMDSGSTPSGRTAAVDRPRAGEPDEMRDFVATVLADTEDTWTEIFKAGGQRYRATPLVLFTGQIRSACGFASAASGPFYCPNDRKVYIDLAFYDELQRKFDAPGDFAQAYVIAHEVGHHVQDLLGVLPAFNEKRQQLGQADANALSVRVELQADCYAGVWGHYAEKKGILDRGDLEEALNAATQIGDDAIQKRTQGYVVPESFNHGSSAERKHWFKIGFDTGDAGSCDTFSTTRL
jgi:predicted metalloprotease